MKFFIGFTMFLIPWVVSAAIVINEIAWMGTTESSYCEWVELYNDGSANVDLSGWGLYEVGLNGNVLIMALTKTIASGGYYLIERVTLSCPDSVPVIIADDAGSFGGSGLSNSGEMLILKNASDDEMDRMDGSSGWQGFGNNTTKDTMQRTSSGDWITAVATPRAANEIGSSISNLEVELPITPPSTPLYEPKRFFTVDAGKDIKTVAGAEVRFSGVAFNGDGKPLGETSGMARYLWNFGDGAFFEGKNVNHIYRYPGIYRAVLYVSSGETSGSDVLEAIVGKSNVAMSEIAGAWVELTNEGATAVDVSSWQIHSDALTYIIPARTTIGPGAFVVFSQEITNLLFGPVNPKAELRYANGTFADMLSFGGMLPPEKSVIRDEEGKGAIGEQTPGRENMNHESGIMNQGKKEKSTIPPIIYNPSFMIQPEESSKIELPQKKEVLQASLFSSNYFWLAVSVSIGLIVGAVVLVLRSMILF